MGKEKPSAGNGFTELGITAKPAEKSGSSGPPVDLYFISCRAAATLEWDRLVSACM
jgi:hypothetical protein